MELRGICVILSLLALLLQVDGLRERDKQRGGSERRRDRDRYRTELNTETRENLDIMASKERPRIKESERREDQVADSSIHQYEAILPAPPRYHSGKSPSVPVLSEEDISEPPKYTTNRGNSLDIIYSANHNSRIKNRESQQGESGGLENLYTPGHNPRTKIREPVLEEAPNLETPYVTGHLPRMKIRDPQMDDESSHLDTTEEAMSDMRPPHPPKLLLPRVTIRHDTQALFGGPSQECKKCGGFTLGVTGTCCKACAKLGYNKGCWCRSCDCLCYDT